MTIDEALSFYKHKQSNIAIALGISRNSVSRWYKNDSIPYDKQCMLEKVTRGKLRARREDDYNERKKRIDF